MAIDSVPTARSFSGRRASVSTDESVQPVREEAEHDVQRPRKADHEGYVKLRDYYILCKPKVVALMLLTSLVGMFLASSGPVSIQLMLFAIAGIGLVASAAAVVNHLADRHIDARMMRTVGRPIPKGRVSTGQAVCFLLLLGISGFSILVFYVNTITACLALASLVGYAFVYTYYLKRATPQNIVIGGLAGALPPLLGWTAITGTIDPNSLLLVLIIFTWTPPHFWALALYRKKEYQTVNIPMLPVTHGEAFTKLNILLYTVLMVVCTLLPYLTGMSGGIYLAGVSVLNLIFLYYSIALKYSQKRRLALKAFRFSIVYLMILFILLLVDHML